MNFVAANATSRRARLVVAPLVSSAKTFLQCLTEERTGSKICSLFLCIYLIINNLGLFSANVIAF
jgi:hypothetical protein